MWASGHFDSVVRSVMKELTKRWGELTVVLLAYMPGLRYKFHLLDVYRECSLQGEEDHQPCKYVEADLSASSFPLILIFL